jgi:hypothetical protein
MLVASRYQHPFITNEVERIELHFLVVNLFHIFQYLKFVAKLAKSDKLRMEMRNFVPVFENY